MGQAGPGRADSVTYLARFSVFAGSCLVFSIATLRLDGNSKALGTFVDALDRVVPELTDALDLDSIVTPSSTGRAQVLRKTVKLAAHRLGNTAAVTKSVYIDPRVFKLSEDLAGIKRVREKRFRDRKYFSVAEQPTLTLLT